MPRKPHNHRRWRFRSSLRILLLTMIGVVALAINVGSFASNSSKNAPASAPQNKEQRVNQVAARPAAREALETLQATAGGKIATLASKETGAYSFVSAGNRGVLATDDASATPEERALAFMGQHGALVGMNSAEQALLTGGDKEQESKAHVSELRGVAVVDDALGDKHVRLNQFYQGVQVFGAQVVVHMNERGIYAVNGAFAPDINVKPQPSLSKETAAQAALASLRKELKGAPLSVGKIELSIYRTGLLEGYYGDNRLAYAVEVSGPMSRREQVFVDAHRGGILNRVALNHQALERRVYHQQYDPEQPEMFVVRREGEPALPGPTPGTTGANPIDNLYDFAGMTYKLYASGFGRDSYDGAGHRMNTLNTVSTNPNNPCPNAWWNGLATNFCPEIDTDDVASHEWTHAYTQYTHGLIYSYQSGALNESYSDIFGETLDLLNGVDAEGGSNNTQPLPDGQRWQIGEDVVSLSQAGLLRDMWTPSRFANADRVGDTENYACGSGDGGGVHSNSGVPNHAYALLVDGTSSLPGGQYNNQTVQGIGLTKALHIYYRAMTVYQTPATNFVNHDQSLQASCSDLVGQPLNRLKTDSTTGEPSGETITTGDCQQVAKAMLAVDMSMPIPCPFGLLLDPNTPEACPGASDLFVEDWESGIDGWTMTSTGVAVDWDNRNWQLDSTLPQNRAGSAAFARNPALGEPGGGSCAPGGDYSGQFTLDSPAISIPAGASNLKLSFDHYVATETPFDGGQLEISRNGGAFQLVPQANYTFNPPNAQLDAAAPVGQNTNPNAGEYAWHGTNTGAQGGSWGTTVVNLGALAQPGDSVKLRFNFSQDGCNGVDGWYVDNIRLYSCPTLNPPVLTLGADYENPDTNGSYTLNWTRPAGASGPETLQESNSSCGPLLSDNAEGGLTQWTTAQQGNGLAPTWMSAPANAKPGYNSATFWAHGVEQQSQNTSTTLTFNNPIQIPSSGFTSLNFSEWYFNEDDDKGLVEVSDDDGATWTAVYTNNRDQGELPDTGADAFVNEGLTRQAIDLTVYSGKAIRLRFTYALGNSNVFLWTQYGWYVDDISITSDNWRDVTTTTNTSHTVSGRAAGTRCYRVNSIYALGGQQVQSPFSNVLSAAVIGGAACTIPLPSRVQVSDFDGDGKTDVAIYQGNGGHWSILNSGNSSVREQTNWGSPGDIPVPGDFDGDRKTDIAVFREAEGNWYIINSLTGAGTVTGWGAPGDKPVPADYDGDGRTDMAVFRRSEGNWYIRNSGGGSAVRGWGNSDDLPVPGDYDRDGKADYAVYRPSEGNWYIINSSDNTVRRQGWGLANDRPVQGDYDGDGKTDVAIWRPDEGTWHITASCGSGQVKQWGNESLGDVPVPGDYDGDGKTDIAVFRAPEGRWYILRSSDLSQVFAPVFGSQGDTPVPSTYIP